MLEIGKYVIIEDKLLCKVIHYKKINELKMYVLSVIILEPNTWGEHIYSIKVHHKHLKLLEKKYNNIIKSIYE